jgi:hypothetical protein
MTSPSKVSSRGVGVPGPVRATYLGLLARVNVTVLFSLRENAIAKEPGSSYLKPWRCVSRLGL